MLERRHDNLDLIKAITSPTSPVELVMALSVPNSPAAIALENKQLDAVMAAICDLEGFLLLMEELRRAKEQREIGREQLEVLLRDLREKERRQLDQESDQSAKVSAHLPPRQAEEIQALQQKLTELDLSYAKASQQWNQAQTAHATNVVSQLATAGLLGANGQPIQFTPQLQQQLIAVNVNVAAAMPKAIQMVEASMQQAGLSPMPVADMAACMGKACNIHQEFKIRGKVAGLPMEGNGEFDPRAYLQSIKLNKGLIKPEIFQQAPGQIQHLETMVGIARQQGIARRELGDLMVAARHSHSPLQTSYRRSGSGP